MAVFYNQASLSYSGGVLSSNRIAGQLTDAASLTKTAVTESYLPGDTVVYALSIVNESAAAITAALTDDLGGYTFDGETVYPLAYKADSLVCFVGGVQQELTVTPGPPLAVQGISIPAGGSAVLVYETEVTAYAPLGEQAAIVNTATLTGGASPITATATVPMAGNPALSIVKTMAPQTVAVGESVTYTFLLQNAGPAAADAAMALSVTDTFDPPLANVAVSLNGAALTPTTDYTYDPASGAFATVAGLITVSAASYAQDETGAWSATPGAAVLTVTGTLTPAAT